LVCLPLNCKKFLNKFKKKPKKVETLKEFYETFKVNGKLKFKYSSETSDKYLKVKTPFKVWKTKSGHRYEISLFAYACLKYIGFNIYYCEMPYFKYGDHAFVLVKLKNKTIKLDLTRKKGFNPKYRKYFILKTFKEIIGSYYFNCAYNVLPWEDDTKKLIEAYEYCKLGLKYRPNSDRGKLILNKIKRRLKVYKCK